MHEQTAYFVNQIQNLNAQYTQETGKIKKCLTHTFGCQMNERDSEILFGFLSQMGYEKTDVEADADFILFNTCCIREKAESKVLSQLGELKKLKQKNPDLIIGVCGCMMQQNGMADMVRSSAPHVDIIFGTHNLHHFPEYLYRVYQGEGRQVVVFEKEEGIQEGLPSYREYPFKALVNIVYGCNNFCTYCIVPYVRGRERSRKPENILAEIRSLVADGVKEIQLLGQNVNSYGKNLENPISFAQLLEQVNEIEGLERIRFMTSHPKDLSQELIDAMAKLDKVCPHFHLPLQSGSSRLLQVMNRHYDQEKYLDIVRRLKEAVPEVSITTDIIVGFPGETREDFLETLKVAEAVRFDGGFTFIYSKREGTPAATMEQVDPEEAKQNFDELLEVMNRIGYENNQKWVGRTMKVLAEEVSKNNPRMLTGRTEHNILVHFEADQKLLGEIVTVTITQATAFYMEGTI